MKHPVIRAVTTVILYFSVLSTFAQSKLIPLQAYSELPAIESVKVSPDGGQIAFYQNVGNDTYLRVTSLVTGESRDLLVSDNQRFKMRHYNWANNDVLLVSFEYPSERWGWASDKVAERRLLRISADGSESFRPVFIPSKQDFKPQFQDKVVSLLPDEPEHVLMELDIKSPTLPAVYKININKKRGRKTVQKQMSNIRRWISDRQGRVRVGVGRSVGRGDRDRKIFTQVYDLESKDWIELWSYVLFDEPEITPLGFGVDPNILYFRADHEGNYAVYRVDVSSEDKSWERVFSDPGSDVLGGLIFSPKTRDAVGVYHGDEDGCLTGMTNTIAFSA